MFVDTKTLWAELKTLFHIMPWLHSSRCTRMFTFVSSHLCLCLSVCVHACVHISVCEACRRMSADICFSVCNLCVCLCMFLSVCVCMDAQAQISARKVIFFSFFGGVLILNLISWFICSREEDSCAYKTECEV